jgi:release factor glutamine methyltransferase
MISKVFLQEINIKINEAYKEAIASLNKFFIDNPSLEAQLLTCHVLDIGLKDFLLRKDLTDISEHDFFLLKELIRKRLSGRSIAEIIKKKSFYDHDFFVNEDVLIPRPETELLIDVCFEKLDKEKIQNIFEIGTGSGIIPIILAGLFKNSIITSIDISRKALETAETNLALYREFINRINLIEADFFNFVTPEKYDLIVSNPPYIPENEAVSLLENKKLSDPFIALSGGKDGLDFYRILELFSIKNLKPDGFLIFEHGFNQREKIKEIFLSGKFEFSFYDDFAGFPRVMALKHTQ